MRYFIIFVVFLFVGCEAVDPAWNKAASEREQTKLMEQQLEQFKRIADALEKAQK